MNPLGAAWGRSFAFWLETHKVKIVQLGWCDLFTLFSNAHTAI
jgi:hypothetical protein